MRCSVGRCARRALDGLVFALVRTSSSAPASGSSPLDRVAAAGPAAAVDEVKGPSDRQITTDPAGVDLTQIRALKAMTPLERVRALVAAANNLLEAKRRARRV